MGGMNRSIFVSWAGKRSHSIASALSHWLPCFSSSFETWMSDDLPAGQRWSTQLAEKLASTDTGILCVTEENHSSPWLNFEAGAISRSVTVSQVIPYAIGIDPADVPHPIGQFQAVRATRAGTLTLLKGLSAALPEPVTIDPKLFSALWPLLESAIAMDPANVPLVDSTLKEIQNFQEARRSLKLLNVTISTDRVRRGESFELEYLIETRSSGLKVWLGAALHLRQGKWKNYLDDDKEIPLKGEKHVYSRNLTVDSATPPGEYPLRVEVWFGPKSDSENSFPLQVQWPTRYKIRVE
jgi:hypothetical protein